MAKYKYRGIKKSILQWNRQEAHFKHEFSTKHFYKLDNYVYFI